MGRQTMFAKQEFTVRLKHAAHLFESQAGVGNRAKSVSQQNRIDTAGIQWHLLGRRIYKLHIDVGRPERTARRILKSLLDKKLLFADTEKGPVRLSFPASVVGYYFPRLYPEGVEITAG